MGLFKKLACGTALATALFFGAETKAEEPPKHSPISITKSLESVVEETPLREIDFFLENPMDSFEANSDFFYSVNQLIGKGSDLLGKEGGLDKSTGARAGLALLSFYFGHASHYYSHEIAHEYEFRKIGQKTTLRIDFSKWFGWMFPTYVQKPAKYSLLTKEAVFRSVVHGLNQEEFNCYNIWKKSFIKRKMNFDEATYFLRLKLADLLYIWSVGFEDKKPRTKNLTTKELFGYFRNTKTWNDVDMYTGFLSNNNIKLSKPEYFIQALIADFASSYSYESLSVIGQYLCEKKRHQKPFSFKLSKDFRISPPLINHYLTSRGGLYNLNTILSYKNHLFQCSLAHDIDCMGGKLRSIRTGVKYHSHQIANIVEVKPFLYITFDRKNIQYTGISTGFETSIKVIKNIFLKAKLEYNENDLIENRVKSEDDGMNFVAGLNVKF